ncbi:hypothetical protein ERW51_17760 [Aliivibrio finisterrensis]|uniref:hypothetical protein n=1 Tax=Aliivibrio finisterrensis TaxID=511998 RepID=UPI001020B54D|nr:hypothetical protein [Aliivibrio finisterrensis]RYU64238.1 hypothetical protein ERW54_18260 [Aliivibrio finisterrensis]RYU67642.1 hypothetical protein ERW51_17760 [Aliivibrio finisterrensis]RYU70665.1 hypothetical protein ERW48_18255 [Aliivibrio finisterrensis]
MLNPDMIVSLLYTILDLTVPEFQQDKVTGWSLIIVGILCFLINHYLNREESATAKQDKSNFLKMNEIICHQNLNNMLNDIGANNTLFSNYEDILDELEDHLENNDTDYYNSQLKKLRKQLKTDLDYFLNFTRRNYFRLDAYRATLRPQLRQSEFFESYVIKQNSHMESFRKSYNKLREAVRKKHQI